MDHRLQPGRDRDRRRRRRAHLRDARLGRERGRVVLRDPLGRRACPVGAPQHLARLERPPLRPPLASRDPFALGRRSSGMRTRFLIAALVALALAPLAHADGLPIADAGSPGRHRRRRRGRPPGRSAHRARHRRRPDRRNGLRVAAPRWPLHRSRRRTRPHRVRPFDRRLDARAHQPAPRASRAPGRASSS